MCVHGAIANSPGKASVTTRKLVRDAPASKMRPRNVEDSERLGASSWKISQIILGNFNNAEFLDAMDVDPPPVSMEEDAPTEADASNKSGSASTFYIKTVPHPHNESGTTSYILLDGGDLPGDTPGPEQVAAHPQPSVPSPACKAWAPFRTRADFEYAESVVLPNMPRKWVDTQLAGIQAGWSNSPSNITFRNYEHMEKSLAAARKYVVQFQRGEVEADFQGTTYRFEFQYRDPWQFDGRFAIRPDSRRTHSLIFNSLFAFALVLQSTRYPAQKFVCKDGVEIRLFDEAYTGNKWWNIQNSLPHIPRMPHCYVPLSLWLDKGTVTKRVRKHPVLLRPLFLPSNIRNASGNGGGILFAYMVMPIDPADPSDRNAAQTLAWAQFKREVMHKVFKIIFAPLLGPAKHGELLTCGDGIQRVCYPGVPITSIDGEEACSVSACRAALANFPCPRCLVHHNDLDKICKTFPLRTTETMKQFYEDAIAAPTKTESERILQSVGLHATENFFWSLPNSDPYSANSYDLLHSDESGKWGKHLWVLLLEVLKENGFKGRLTLNLGKIPRWPNLKHFPNVTTEDYTDDSALIHCIQFYQLYRFLIGLECITEDMIARLRKYMAKYEKYCKLVKDQYGKDFRYYKQHACTHVIPDIEDKGPPAGYSTRPGEGFHQEVKEAFNQTNFKNTDPQLARIDENKEAFARIRMAIDEYDALHSVAQEEDMFDEDASDVQWTLGSPLKWTTAEQLQQDLKDKNFAAKLRVFLNDFVVDLPLQPHDMIEIKPHRCIRLKYQSCVNWTEKTDILRCNPNFHNNRRYDHVLVNDKPEDLTVAHLVQLLRCRLPDKSLHDIAVASKPSLTFLNDLIDGDMFLRAGN
ncbi:hypothetical protein DFH08DRAFT_808700 [Mycena albidolilacea]|uniref:Uncharacterized protein n=1 Tax=Mycena albidolilacea TaxID=1033008 RepID=A0AAD7A1Y7_9AGAR|nr:hypothetical protein DFH08DRAFT_808700 [Mycena albidolilacea]